MQEFKVGDTVQVPMKIIDEGLGKYGLSYKDLCSFRADKKILGEIAAEKSYEDGLSEAWELARRIISTREFHYADIANIFKVDRENVLEKFSAQEAAAKIKAWEEGKKFHVGDVVRHHGKECVVTKIFDSDPEKCYLLWEDGGTGTGAFSKFEKTGRTIDIAGILAEIGGADAV